MNPGADGRMIIDNVTKNNNIKESKIDKLFTPIMECEIIIIFNRYMPQINILKKNILDILPYPLIFKNADLNKDQSNKLPFLRKIK